MNETTDERTLYLRACDVFDARVHGVGADQWEASTPCTEWDVRQLVNHVTVEDLWVPPLLSGRTMAEMGDAFDGDRPPSAGHRAGPDPSSGVAIR